MAQRTVDLIDIGVPMEIANRLGDNGPQYFTSATATITSVQSTTAVIGGNNGANQLIINASASSSLTFSPATELGDEFRIANIGTVITLYTPVSTSGTWNTTLGSAATTSVTLASGKSAIVFRAGPLPFPTGSIQSDFWVFLSA